VYWVNWGNLELRLVGLLGADLLTLGLGLLLPSPWERRQIIIHTPLPSRLLDRVKFCRLGKLRLDLTGQELPLP
jgi:polynucleotide 5'-kinase involved in rRNA processing